MTAYLRAFWICIIAMCGAMFLALAVQNLIADVSAKAWRPLW